MSDQYIGGKGDRRRKEDINKINQNWDKIFKNKKNGSKQNTNEKIR